MRAGRLDRIIDIQRKTDTQDEYGQAISTWNNIATRIPASIKSLRGDERFEASQFIAREQVEFMVRYSTGIADLNPLDRIVYPAIETGSSPDSFEPQHLYDIVDVSEVGRREGLRIVAARRAEQ